MDNFLGEYYRNHLEVKTGDEVAKNCDYCQKGQPHQHAVVYTTDGGEEAYRFEGVTSLIGNEETRFMG